MSLLKIKRDDLLVVAGLVWIAAGANVANLGIRAALGMNVQVELGCTIAVGAVAVFFAFHSMFGKLVKRNARRIRALEGAKQSPLRFLDTRGYAIMAAMMSGGFGLRAAGLVPDWFVAFFYTGLGSALTLAGIGFFLHRAHGEGWTFHMQKSESAR